MALSGSPLLQKCAHFAIDIRHSAVHPCPVTLSRKADPAKPPTLRSKPAPSGPDHPYDFVGFFQDWRGDFAGLRGTACQYLVDLGHVIHQPRHFA